MGSTFSTAAAPPRISARREVLLVPPPPRVPCRVESAFDEWLCSLPTSSAWPEGITASLLGEHSDFAPVSDAMTVGKYVARWAMMLHLSTTTEPPYRFVPPHRVLREWAWRPQAAPRHARCEAADAWLAADVCAARTARSRHQETITAAARAAVAEARRAAIGTPRANHQAGAAAARLEATTRVSNGAALWWAGALLRRVIHRGLGKCGEAAVVRRLQPAARSRGPATCSNGSLAATDRSDLAQAPAVAVHVRRGDACERWAAPGDARTRRGFGRPCFATVEYLRAARKVCRVLLRPSSPGLVRRCRLLVASDSPTAADELAVLASRDPPQGDGGDGGDGGAGEIEVEIEQVRAPRGAGWGGAYGVGESSRNRTSSMTSSAEFIERRNARGLVDRELTLSSLFADARLLVDAGGFVGTTGWTSRLLLYAVLGGRTATPPFVLLDQPLGPHLWRSSGWAAKPDLRAESKQRGRRRGASDSAQATKKPTS